MQMLEYRGAAPIHYSLKSLDSMVRVDGYIRLGLAFSNQDFDKFDSAEELNLYVDGIWVVVGKEIEDAASAVFSFNEVMHYSSSMFTSILGGTLITRSSPLALFSPLAFRL